MRKRRSIPCVLELPDHLGVRELLRGVGSAQLEQCAHEGGFSHLVERENVLRDSGLHYRVTHVGAPALLVIRKSRCPRISSQVQVVIEAIAKRLRAFLKAPVRRAYKLETPHERVLKALVQQKS